MNVTSNVVIAGPGTYNIEATHYDIQSDRWMVYFNDGKGFAFDGVSLRLTPRVGYACMVKEDGTAEVFPVPFKLMGKQGMMGGATAAAIAPTNDDTTERLIQQKGKTAPRVIPAQIKAEVVSCHFFTASDGVVGESPNTQVDSGIPWGPLGLLTFCVLVLKNGFTVTGESACASPENFDAEIGRKIARENAEDKIWPLLGFRLKDQLVSVAAAEAQPFVGGAFVE